MGQAIDLPLRHGPGWFIVMEQGDQMFTREVGVIADGAGKLPSGTVMMRLKADRTVNGTVQKAGTYVAYEDGADNAVFLWEGIDARVKGAKRTLTVRDAQYQLAAITFGVPLSDAQVRTALTLLATNNLVAR